MTSAEGLRSNWAGVLCYLIPIVGPIVFLLLAPYNRDSRIRFHAWQALFLQIVWMGAHLVANILHEVSWTLADTLHKMIGWAYIALVAICAIKAYQDDKFEIPVIGAMAEKRK